MISKTDSRRLKWMTPKEVKYCICPMSCNACSLVCSTFLVHSWFLSFMDQSKLSFYSYLKFLFTYTIQCCSIENQQSPIYAVDLHSSRLPDECWDCWHKLAPFDLFLPAIMQTLPWLPTTWPWRKTTVLCSGGLQTRAKQTQDSCLQLVKLSLASKWRTCHKWLHEWLKS